MIDTVQLLTASGVGAIAAVLVQAWLTYKTDTKKRNFSEKKEAYIGLWSAHLNISAKDADAAMRDFIYWHMRCEMIAPLLVRKAIQGVIDTNKGTPAERTTAHEGLKEEIRKDLGVIED